MRRSCAILIPLLLAAAPANDTQRGLAALQALDTRVAAISHRIAVGGVGLCPDHVRRAGFSVQGLAQYAPAVRADARALFGLGDAPTVLAVAPGSSADRAGLKAGEAILAIDEQNVGQATRPDAKAAYDGVAAVETRIETALTTPPMTLRLRDRTIEIAGDEGCRSRVQVVPGTVFNASADGTYVQLSSRIAEFAASDDELALVIAHEMAHNILKHRETLDQEGVSRGLLRAFGKNRTRIRATETAADRFALYLMARAGYDIGVAPAFWDRFGRVNDFGIFADGTHHSRRERVTAAQREIAIIRAQIAAGQGPRSR